MALAPGFGESFKKETWTLYSVGMFGVVLRYVARIRRLGIAHLQTDDYVMMFGMIWYTILCVALNEVASGGGSNLMTDADIASLTPSIYAERVRGSKWVFVSEHAFILAIWSCKCCMLIIYSRITDGTAQRRLINYCAIYVALGWLGTELGLFLTCIPLTNYWAVPTPNPQCSSYQHYEIIQGCFSISADIFMLSVAIPLLLKIKLPTKQKLILVLLFGMGVFVIVAAVLTKVYCLVPSLISYVYMNWYFREATVAILVTNIPLVWSLLRDVFPGLLKSWTGGSKKASGRYYPSAPWSNSKSGVSRGFGVASQVRSAARSHYDIEEMGPMPQKEDSRVSISQRSGDSPNSISDDGSARALRIRQDITVTIEEEERRGSKFITSAHGWSDNQTEGRKRSSA